MFNQGKSASHQSVSDSSFRAGTPNMSNSANRWPELSLPELSSTSAGAGASDTSAIKKLQRKIQTVLTNFNPNASNNDVMGTTATIVKIIKKYGPEVVKNIDHQSEAISSSSTSTSKFMAKTKNHKIVKSTPAKSAKPAKKTISKKLALERELARLADSDGFISTTPRRSKRKSKAVVRFDETTYDRKATLRPASHRSTSEFGILHRTIEKNVRRSKIIETSVVNVAHQKISSQASSQTTSQASLQTSSQASSQTTLQTTSQTRSLLMSDGDRFKNVSVQSTLQHTVTTQQTTRCVTSAMKAIGNFQHKGARIYHMPMIEVKSEY